VARQPRDFVEPAEAQAFGRAKTITWLAPTDATRAEGSAAYRQHVITVAANAAMKAKGETRGQLAERIGTGAETLRRKLRGEQWLTFVDVSVLAQAFSPGTIPVEPPDGAEPPGWPPRPDPDNPAAG